MMGQFKSFILCVAVFGNVISLPTPLQPFHFITKEQWQGLPPVSVTLLDTPVPTVIIHHTHIPGACFNQKDCSQSMRSMQRYHQVDQGWADIGYNFAIGSDGAVYEGRGWNAVGAHAATFNSRSIGIALIGSWVDASPPEKQLLVAKELISFGISSGFIRPDYKLIGHRDVGSTECPGQTLYNVIRTWPHYDNTAQALV